MLRSHRTLKLPVSIVICTIRGQELAERMRIGIDGRRGTVFSGVGRVTSNFLNGLVDLDQENEYVVFVNKTDTTDIEQLKDRRNVEFVSTRILQFTKSDLYDFPAVVSEKKVDVFFTLQFYAPPFLKCPTVKMVHDLWATNHPEWLPDVPEFVRYFGEEGLLGVYELTDLFVEAVKAGSILPSNSFARDSIRQLSPRTPLLGAIARMSYTLTSATTVVVPSESTVREINASFPEVSEKVVVVPNFPASVFKPGDHAGESNHLLHVSKWEPRKNLEGMFQGVKLANEQLTAPVRLTLVGDTRYRRTYGDTISEMISRRPFSEFVQSRGIVSDQELASLYRSARALVYPSFHEGFGLPAVEAMACGTPVVTSKVAALPEVCGDAALFVDPAKPREIAEAVVRVCSEEPIREGLRQRGIKRARDFDETRIVRKLLQVLESAC